MSNKMNEGGVWPSVQHADDYRRCVSCSFRPYAIVYQAITDKQQEMSHELPTVTKSDAINAMLLELIDLKKGE